jgi:hypothetical protein
MKLNEGRGISEPSKQEIEKIFNLFLKNGYGKLPYKLLNKIILIEFCKNDNYDSFFYKNNKIHIMTFSIPENYDTIKLKEIITHEITHFIEIYNIEKKGFNYPNYNKIKLSLSEYNPKSKVMKFFKYLIYKTLDNEINANISQTYTYLKSFNSSDEDFLRNKLEKYEVRKDYTDIININVESLIIDISDEIEELKFFNQKLIDNDVFNFYTFLLKIDNVPFYIRSWMKIIKNNSKKVIKKQDNIIKEVIEDQNYSTEFTVSENSILNYKEYLKENLNNDESKRSFGKI